MEMRSFLKSQTPSSQIGNNDECDLFSRQSIEIGAHCLNFESTLGATKFEDDMFELSCKVYKHHRKHEFARLFLHDYVQYHK